MSVQIRRRQGFRALRDAVLRMAPQHKGLGLIDFRATRPDAPREAAHLDPRLALDASAPFLWINRARRRSS
ncbi:hypothetical protein [Hansschlegelia beijingensis]|uniref:Uncharacterized protein n=1 Tax=Hansschlegelia beijingensis TaxID=1133344 RepID=A0A7W6D5C0_9HYPH|nr:hypothetical protein [Hansschlegelia beijingensis]MBB3974535.1 hypothetical protein [Hansschlegelia beijingensis]